MVVAVQETRTVLPSTATAGSAGFGGGSDFCGGGVPAWRYEAMAASNASMSRCWSGRLTADGGCVRRRPDVGERVDPEAEHTQDGLRGIVDPFTDSMKERAPVSTAAAAAHSSARPGPAAPASRGDRAPDR